MHALNLYPEQTLASVKDKSIETSHGMSRSNQDESSFNVALKKAEKELKEPVQEAPKEQQTTKVMDEKNNSQLDLSQLEDKVDISEISENSIEWVTTDPELQIIQETASNAIENQEQLSDNILDSQLNQLESFVKENTTQDNIESEVLLNISDETKVSALLENQDLLENLRSEINEKESDTPKVTKTNKNDENVSDEALLYSMLTGNIGNPTENINADLSESSLSDKIKNLGKKEKADSLKDGVISVIDERTSIGENQSKNEFVTSIQKTGEDSAQMTLTISPEKQNNLQFEGVVKSNANQPSTFSTMLAEQLQTNSGDFVKAGSMVLKDNKQGTINLVLHPDELGCVKIQLELSDNVIAGKIVVATKEAYEAFKSSLNSLKEAFNNSGFQNTGFDLSWSGNGNGKDNSQDQNFRGLQYAQKVPEYSSDDYGVMLARDAVIYGSSLIDVMA